MELADAVTQSGEAVPGQKDLEIILLKVSFQAALFTPSLSNTTSPKSLSKCSICCTEKMQPILM